MKNMWKKGIGAVLALSLVLAGVLPMVNSADAQAAGWWFANGQVVKNSGVLKKADLTKTKTKNGNYSFLDSDEVKTAAKNHTYAWQMFNGKDTALKSTNRGISLGTALSKVYKKYGKTKLVKSATAKKQWINQRDPQNEKRLFKEFQKYAGASKSDLKQFVEYNCNWYASDENNQIETAMAIRFYIDDKNKVVAVAYIMGMRDV